MNNRFMITTRADGKRERSYLMTYEEFRRMWAAQSRMQTFLVRSVITDDEVGQRVFVQNMPT